ncbi:MAG: UDP-3-O-(3-hydroxymyristoyl)glucosamine N-acyltransferase [bacterium]|nr:UDP-3-O-(3-hydroxymyristoyl)glucosamine N-acyltransferase [bacterium]
MRYTLEEIAQLIRGSLYGPPNLVITGVNSPELAKETDICVIYDDRLIDLVKDRNIGAVVVKEGLSIDKPYIVVSDPKAIMPVLLGLFLKKKILQGIDRTAIIGNNCNISETCFIGPYVVIGDNVKLGERVTIMAGSKIGDEVVIGDDSFIGYNVIVEEKTIIGKRVKIQHGAIIGKEGFGFYRSKDGYIRIPHLGNVVIEDDVEIGANSIVDRATLGSTVIKRGTKIDSLVLIAHNVKIGEDTAIAGQTGIAGSSEIGARCMIGGQVGITDHLRVGDNSVIFAKSGVIGDLPSNSIVSGTPARSHREWLKAQAILLKLPKIIKQLRMKDVADNDKG